MTEADRHGEGFSEFVAGALPGLLRFGYMLTGSPEEAEDLTHEALARCLRRWRRVSVDDPVAYVRRAMINTYLTQQRRWGSRVRLGDVPEGAAEDAALMRHEDWDALRIALSALPRGQRTVLVLRYLEDLSDSSIAALLGCQPATVRTRAARGLAALRPLMTAQTPGPLGGGDTHAR